MKFSLFLSLSLFFFPKFFSCSLFSSKFWISQFFTAQMLMFYYLLALFQVPMKYLQPTIQLLSGTRSLGDSKGYHFLTPFHNHHNSKVKTEQHFHQTNFYFSYCVCYVYIQLLFQSISSKEKHIKYISCFFLAGQVSMISRERGICKYVYFFNVNLFLSPWKIDN